jgi:LmbE family N-acetylglucosaminyl deacetylase
MIGCRFGSAKKILCLGAHSDDIEIGCGGTILKLIRQQPGIDFLFAVFSAQGERKHEAERSAGEFLRESGGSEIVLFDFRESYFPAQWESIKDAIESLRSRFDPDLVFTHFRNDLHQDHKTISDLTWTSFRNHLILEYEVPKYDGDLAHPNLFVPLSAELCDAKLGLIQKHFASQTGKYWFKPETFKSLMKLRGIECATAYAEAFHCRKMVF